MQQKKIFIFLGTTAELIKIVPVIRAFKRKRVRVTIVTSGQNDIHFEEFAQLTGKLYIIRAISPKGNSSSIAKFLVWTARTFFSLLLGMRSNFAGLNKQNSLFIVHGDTVSSLMGSLVARLYGLKLVHIESGLRSFNFFEPFPEEICRYIISRIADVHFCPNEWSMNNLHGVNGDKVNTKENTLIDTFYSVIKQSPKDVVVKRILKQKKRYFVLVIHRQEHVLFQTKKTQQLMKFVLSSAPSELTCLFLIHDISSNFVQSLSYLIPREVEKNIITLKRLSYGDFMHVLERAEFLVTDGGSNQEEMYYMGKPCLLLRTTTERREGLHENVVLSKNNTRTIANFMKQYRSYRRPMVKIRTSPSSLVVSHLLY